MLGVRDMGAAMLLVLMVFSVGFTLENRASGANLTVISPCLSSFEEELQLLTMDEFDRFEALVNPSNQSLTFDGEGNMFTIASVLGRDNVVGSDNFFIQTLTGDFVRFGDSNRLACSSLQEGTLDLLLLGDESQA